MGFNYVKPTPNTLNHDWSKSIEAEYERDKDGKFVWYDNDGKVVSGDIDPNLHHRQWIGGANSQALLDAYDNLFKIADYNENDTFQGYNGIDKQRYINFANSLTPESRQALRDRIRNGTWTANDREMLNDIGLLLGNDIKNQNGATDTSESEEESEDVKKLKAAISAVGLNPDNSYVKGLGLVANDDGTFNVTNNPFGDQNLYINKY